METIKALGIVGIFLLVGLILFYLAMYVAERCMNKKITVLSLFKNFRQKMWMTVGLGFLFSSLYLLIVYVASSFFNSPMRLDFFHLIYNHPVAFIYLGLFTFAYISTIIYFARMTIIYLYNKKNKH